MQDDKAEMFSYEDLRETRLEPSRKLKKAVNPLQAGIMDFLAICQEANPFQESDIPKRYTRYGSLLLLGPTFSSYSVPWSKIFCSLIETDKADLFYRILKAFKDDTLTHVAINAPISTANVRSSENNVMRSPGGFQPVYGDFGPAEYDRVNLSHDDFARAYWVQTTQLNNIVQVWAPRWTMFSRGNISEKARILQNQVSKSPFPGLSDAELGQTIGRTDVVDFFVGIGYFAFCYLQRGAARVWGWDINGWSVEGLRRGCVKNGWGVRVIRVDGDGSVSGCQGIKGLVDDIRHHEHTANPVRCIVFWGDNKWSGKVLQGVNSFMNTPSEESVLNIRHCNLGLLPTSENSWVDAVRVISHDRGGWLHIHENVARTDIDTKKKYILQKLEQISYKTGKDTFAARCCHVEQVKTYAPGVVHCVYDIELYRL